MARRMTTRRLTASSALGFVLALAPLGCGGESPASGLSAYLRATNAQFEPGELASVGVPGDAAKPSVDNVKSNNSHVFPGAQGRTVTGSVTGTSTALLVGLAGDTAHWLVPVGGIADLDVEGNVLFTTALSFSPDLPAGDRNLVFRAVDEDGVVGPAQTLALKVDDPTPKGALIIELQWDTQADLDLHVHITPDDATVKPFDVWEKAPTALPAGALNDADVKAAGQLSLDSNARCSIDGVRLERLVFDTTYPVGTYEVRVDTFSLCSEATSRWHAKAYRNTTGTSQTIVEAYGQSIDRDTLGSHNATSGLFALIFASP
jgi:hypothetical protein